MEVLHYISVPVAEAVPTQTLHLKTKPLPMNELKWVLCFLGSIDGEYVPMEGDEVTYKVCPIPPKNQKIQAVEVVLTHLYPGTKHETWSGQIISS